MLLLTADQVKPCKVICPNVDGTEWLDGISYKNELFMRESAYPKAKKETAVDHARALFLEKKGLVSILVVEDFDEYVVWQADQRLNQIPETIVRDQAIAEIDLERLISQIRDIGGIQIKDRRYNLQVYPRCFVGSELVDWFVHVLLLSREDGVKLGQRLINQHVVHHVVDEHAFEDGYLFYRFYWDEEDRAIESPFS